MLEQFKGFIGYTDEEFKRLWEKAVIVVDTNVLLNFYKYTSKESTKSLLDILKILKEENRLWIPHQVALEYFFNYETNMFKQHEGYNLLGSELKKLKEDAKKSLRTVQSEHPYIVTDNFQFYIEDIEKSNDKLQEQLDKEIANLPYSKETQDELLLLLDGVIGDPYTQDMINAIEKDGLERYVHNVPPGFKDKDKNSMKDYRTYGDIRYQQKYGDLIVWNQMLDRAKREENPTSIIFITEEKKEDWWEKESGKIKRPQPQLIQEFINKTNQLFYMYRTENFVQYAKEYLGADITDEEVENVTKDVEQIRRAEESSNSDLENEYQATINRNEQKEKLRNLNINKLMEYLSQEELDTFRKRIDMAFSINTHPNSANAKYNHAIEWAIKLALNKLENQLRQLLGQIAIKDYDKVQSYLPLLDSFPENSVEKGLLLLEYIEEIENALHKIDINENFPF
ncbi:PIN-like domain-containing protein [Evansella sp. AB-P1]|uniref:PIN-like domain-containing protein n=1 Tax=Evansella sp. AB-P1 TaxID=3037653 RepID=UPI002420306D|nr:PIN-like domain-containing protein [Evansella sp. AB-P1]MDG5789658.1 PIN-like domain-containing protein [Evansella sp. AB-P1]